MRSPARLAREPALARSGPGVLPRDRQKRIAGVSAPAATVRSMTALPESARTVLESAALAHLVTLEPDGSPQVSIVWVGLDGDEIVAAHLPEHRKIRNVRRDPRVALSVEAGSHNAIGLAEYLVVHGQARITEGGAPRLLQQLAGRIWGRTSSFRRWMIRRRATSLTSPLSASAASDPGPAESGPHTHSAVRG